MKNESIKEILIRRDGMTANEAEKLITEAKITLIHYLANGYTNEAEDICAEFFGLEPDYIMELI